jgi:hypothetical protein
VGKRKFIIGVSNAETGDLQTYAKSARGLQGTLEAGTPQRTGELVLTDGTMRLEPVGLFHVFTFPSRKAIVLGVVDAGLLKPSCRILAPVPSIPRPHVF